MRKLVFALLALALLAGYYVLGTGYLKQRQETAQLAVEIAAARQALARVPARPARLDLQLQAALAAEASARKELPERPDTTQSLNTILRLADDCGVRAVPLITQAWTKETIAGYEYEVFRLDLSASGDFGRVKDFLARLETGAPETLVVEYLKLTRPDDQPAGGNVSAALRVAIYARPTGQR